MHPLYVVNCDYLPLFIEERRAAAKGPSQAQLRFQGKVSCAVAVGHLELRPSSSACGVTAIYSEWVMVVIGSWSKLSTAGISPAMAPLMSISWTFWQMMAAGP